MKMNRIVTSLFLTLIFAGVCSAGRPNRVDREVVVSAKWQKGSYVTMEVHYAIEGGTAPWENVLGELYAVRSESYPGTTLEKKHHLCQLPNKAPGSRIVKVQVPVEFVNGESLTLMILTHRTDMSFGSIHLLSPEEK